MKKSIWKRAFLVIALACALIWSVATSAHISRPVSAVATFQYEDVGIQTPMEKGDMLMVWRAVNLHHLSRKTIPSCGFDEACSVTLIDKNGRATTVCFACDLCSNYYLLEEDAYCSTTSFRGDKVKEMLHKYGFMFPCE